MVTIGLSPSNPDAMRLLAFLFALCLAAPAAAAPHVDLVVVGPGDDVFTLYGHAGMLVRPDAATPLEQGTLYNFGITSFDRPNYVRDFLTGRVEFWGKPQAFPRNLERWQREDRTVVRHPLNLPPAQARWLAERLAYVTTPERRNFVYDTFRRNCATWLRDLVDEATGGAVYAAVGDAHTEHSYRDDVREAYAGQPVLLLMTEVVPGVELDRPRTLWERAYLPAHLAEALGRVTLNDAEGERPLLGEAEVLRTRAGPDPREGSPQRAQVFLVVLALVLAGMAVVIGRLGPRWRGAVLALYALGAGLVGTVLLVVGATSDWPDMQHNWLLLAVVPLDVCLLWPAARLIGWRRPAGTLARTWLGLRAATTLALVLVTPLFTELRGPLPPRLVALAGLALAWRCLGRPAARRRGRREPPPRAARPQPVGITDEAAIGPPRNVNARADT